MPETNERYRRLIELSPDGVFISQDGRITFVNPAAVRLCGASAAEQLLGRPLFEMLDRANASAMQGQFSRLSPGESAPPFEAALVGLDGPIKQVETIVTCLEESPSLAFRVHVRDLTERKRTEAALRESEERLKLAFAGAQEGVWDWNLETGAVVYSDRWKQMLGYDDHEIEPHVSAWERLLHPDDRARADEVMESVRMGARTYQGEFRLRHKEGHFLYVLSRGFPVRREPDGPVVRIVGTHFDLTERRRADAERARTELLARLVFAQEDERRRIAREMHDQFGERLTELGLRIRALRQAIGDRADLGAGIDALDKVAQQLDRDVDHLVWELRPTALDDLGLRAALTNYVQDWSTRVEISAELHTSGLLDDRLASETETALYRIAQEALTNVARHSRARNVDIILERRADSVLLIVEDDGVGFEPGDGPAASQGFGLLGMQERAALVGATLQIESAVGKGTTVLVRMGAGAASGAAEHA